MAGNSRANNFCFIPTDQFVSDDVGRLLVVVKGIRVSPEVEVKRDTIAGKLSDI